MLSVAYQRSLKILRVIINWEVPAHVAQKFPSWRIKLLQPQRSSFVIKSNCPKVVILLILYLIDGARSITPHFLELNIEKNTKRKYDNHLTQFFITRFVLICWWSIRYIEYFECSCLLKGYVYMAYQNTSIMFISRP